MTKTWIPVDEHFARVEARQYPETVSEEEYDLLEQLMQQEGSLSFRVCKTPNCTTEIPANSRNSYCESCGKTRESLWNTGRKIKEIDKLTEKSVRNR